jgi:hypothetical protein
MIWQVGLLVRGGEIGETTLENRVSWYSWNTLCGCFRVWFEVAD